MVSNNFTMSLTPDSLLRLVKAQLENMIPDGIALEFGEYELGLTLERLEHCFRHIHRKYYYEDGNTFFDHLYGDQYCAFLYFFSNVLYKQGNIRDANKLYLLNKHLFACDVFYAIQLPEVFYLSHPLGTVLGRAQYGNYFIAYQGVTVGSNLNDQGGAGTYPIIGEACTLFSNTSIIGDCSIGSNVIVGAGVRVLKSDIADNSMVVSSSPDIKLIPNKRNNVDYFFRTESRAQTY